MQLRIDALESHLAKMLGRLYIVYGDELLLVQEAVAHIRSAARAAAFTERSILSVDRGFDWSLLLGAMQSMSLFGERQIVELRIPTQKLDKNSGEALKTLAALDNPDALVLITLPRLDVVTQKTSWFAALLQAGIAVRIDTIERTQLPNWITKRLAAQQQSFVPGDEGLQTLHFITERVEGNLLAAHQEIQKLGWLYPAGELTLKQVRDVMLNVARYDVFSLNETMLSGNVLRLSRMLDGLRGAGETPVLVLWAIVEEIRALIRIKRGLTAGKSLAILMRENRVCKMCEKLMPLALQRVNESLLERALWLAVRLDRQIKGLCSVARAMHLSIEPADTLLPPADPWDGLFDLAMMIAQPGAIDTAAVRKIGS
ncbi:DNA polymerase III subunit delta [Candidatus Vallotia lariciata]|uniref:DNA polymerase III subunit delta n=1 Tax=Candidatus Vallotia laricis TaxID=2018052 RepID=UPI001D012617|nr:DNA polymerase III subunit delta [Candidatus Vallotia lariciata]UDG82835.1 DNA polymerase III subunit delta [Candidatus Vallotia lariciata]